MLNAESSEISAVLDVECMYRTHYSAVMRYVRARVRSREVAEDLVSDVFCRAVGAARRYVPLRQTTLPWLYTIAAHRVADHYRRQRPTCALDTVFGICEDAPSPDDVVAQRDQVEQIWEAAKMLPPAQRRALWLRYGEGRDLKEIAVRMDRSVEAVKLLIHRATRTIKGRLEAGTTHLPAALAQAAA